MGVWDEVEALVADGKGARIRVSEVQEVKLPKKKCSETRIHHRRQWVQYAGSTDGLKRPRCKATGCFKYLRQEQTVACSPTCAAELLNESLRIIALLRYDLVKRVDEYEPALHGAQALKKALQEV